MYFISKDLAKRTVSDKVLRDRTHEIAINPKYNGCERRWLSMVYQFFDKKIGSGATSKRGTNVNEMLMQELHKPVYAIIIFIIFWDFSMFYQIFLSPQVKQCAIITNKYGIYELPYELRKELRLRILGN